MLIITGIIRSGTSPLARIASQMGICMGVTTSFPAPGTEVEYEDFQIINPLSNTAFEGQELHDPAGMLRAYIRNRQARYKITRRVYAPGHVHGWGLKSPYLMLYWDALKEAARAESEPLKVVLTYRPVSEIQKSIEAVVNRMATEYRKEWYAKFKRVIERMRAVRSTVKEDADVEIALSETRSDPTVPARKIAALMGAEGVDFSRAVRGIFGGAA